MVIVFRDPDDVIMLYSVGALQSAATMGYNFIITDIALDAYGDPWHPIEELINEKYIIVRSLNASDMEQVGLLFGKYSTQLSVADCSSIYCAISTKGMLITDQEILLKISNSYRFKTQTTTNFHNYVSVNQTG